MKSAIIPSDPDVDHCLVIPHQQVKSEIIPDKIGALKSGIIPANAGACVDHVNMGGTAKFAAPVLVVFLIIGIFGFYQWGTVHLRETLEGSKWENDTNFDADTTLEFYGDKIDYSYDAGGWFGSMNVAYLDYEVVSPFMIKVDGQKINVRIKDDQITFKPSFVSSKSEDVWEKEW